MIKEYLLFEYYAKIQVINITLNVDRLKRMISFIEDMKVS